MATHSSLINCTVPLKYMHPICFYDFRNIFIEMAMCMIERLSQLVDKSHDLYFAAAYYQSIQSIFVPFFLVSLLLILLKIIKFHSVFWFFFFRSDHKILVPVHGPDNSTNCDISVHVLPKETIFVCKVCIRESQFHI